MKSWERGGPWEGNDRRASFRTWGGLFAALPVSFLFNLSAAWLFFSSFVLSRFSPFHLSLPGSILPGSAHLLLRCPRTLSLLFLQFLSLSSPPPSQWSRAAPASLTLSFPGSSAVVFGSEPLHSAVEERWGKHGAGCSEPIALLLRLLA